MEIKTRYNIHLVFFLLFILLSPLVIKKTYADLPADKYLWIEFDKTENIDGNIVQPLYIYYGQFPSKKSNTGLLDHMEAFYTCGNKDKNGRNIFYNAEIKKKDNMSCVEIKSSGVSWYKVIIKGKIKEDGIGYNYAAETSFFLFGENYAANKIKSAEVNINESGKWLDIRIFREHIKDILTCNRKRKFPIRARVFFENKPLENVKIAIFNREPGKTLTTSRGGSFVYTPETIKREESSGKIIDQDFIAAAKKINNMAYKTSYTVIFDERMRFFIKGGHNILLGIIIFLISFSGIMSLTILSRKKLYESL